MQRMMGKLHALDTRLVFLIYFFLKFFLFSYKHENVFGRTNSINDYSLRKLLKN